MALLLNFAKLQLALMCHTQFPEQLLGTLLIYIRFIKSCYRRSPITTEGKLMCLEVA
ncbi:hypothetical protein [Dendronalium sp. ChiSLP03b]|uniref:hypothetical protein n=1 Tax=Dendronalium sp. ChiSLP03b TaxID=3075381 RepID=UPI002AD53E4D|nr:hypothetical protein [Dendronalium sp. ChiSLP03b]MDZ8207563.1 hypothetical protein [Dendronalium sp. ChiSLP03b]